MLPLSPGQFEPQKELFNSSRLRRPYAPRSGPPVEMLPKRGFHDAANKHGVFIRFGDWPANERSANHAMGGTEEGVSVYDMAGPHAEPVDPDPNDSRYDYDLQGMREWHEDMHGTLDDFDPDDYDLRGNDTGEEMRGRRAAALKEASWNNSWVPQEEQYAGRRGHFVKGSVVGFGHDDEPLLQNVRKVGDWPKDAHRFVPGTQPGFWDKYTARSFFPQTGGGGMA